jgi:O-methyltransferase
VRARFVSGLARIWPVLTFPATVSFFFSDPRIHPSHGLSRFDLWRLAWRMLRTTRGVRAATSYKAHIAMAVKLLAIPRDVPGVVVECGSFMGGSTANLSLACAAAGRELIVYDSFDGLPVPRGNDRYANERQTGALRGPLEVVRDNVRRFGRLDRCTFRAGWFEQTLPAHTEPVALAFLDVDYQASLEECVRELWPHLLEEGYLFVDEYVLLDYCALFWSERWWRKNFDRNPPGLLGSGAGVGVGQYYLGPAREWLASQDPASVAYTRKGFSGYWDYDAAEAARVDDPDSMLVENMIIALDSGSGSRDG